MLKIFGIVFDHYGQVRNHFDLLLLLSEKTKGIFPLAAMVKADRLVQIR